MGVGRPPWQPTKEQHMQVTIMSACGLPVEYIATQVINSMTNKPIGLATLYDKFRDDLGDGGSRANGMVAQSLFKKALGTGPQSVTAAIFWLKARAKWRDTHAIELTGRDGKPVEMVDPSRLKEIPEELLNATLATVELLQSVSKKDEPTEQQ